MSEKQLDLFGNEHEISDVNNKQRYVKRSVHELSATFRQAYGYDETHACEQCAHCIKRGAYHKCEKMGVTNTEETNINAYNKSCRLFIEKEQ